MKSWKEKNEKRQGALENMGMNILEKTQMIIQIEPQC